MHVLFSFRCDHMPLQKCHFLMRLLQCCRSRNAAQKRCVCEIPATETLTCLQYALAYTTTLLPPVGTN